ncbi:molybdenum cofactor guanylyltransferase MobA [Acerihabitans arboris]|uniref:Molybdenum cofactor guanylyltransferase n=1 Tax=Acerihabitans arboris TaxID=2691583 RepID=A0A845SQ62_9GAMM|nr:molybdenum cofactor guanylyltransferase MobA [Acerihabitans arboris]NDL64708.1 molybdenum cofactor guanylyltransferase MobA [Acerihabitans arboris]
MKADITGVILAGGQSTRMAGKDKGLVMVNQRPLYQYVLDGLSRQVDTVILNANRNLELYRQSGLQVVTDTLPDYPGPLAGILAGLQAAQTQWAMFAPCDVPVFPLDLVQRLWDGKRMASAAFASSGGQDHPAFALLNRSLIDPLETFLTQGERKVMLFYTRIGAERVVFPVKTPNFHNLNTPLDVQNWAKS